MAIVWNKHTCLLTGATGGIGKAFARALAEKGVRLILTGRNQQALAELHDTLPGDHLLVCTDIGSDEGREKLAKACLAHPPTMLINNAGITTTGEFGKTATSAIHNVLEVNLLAPILLTHRLMPLLQRAPAAIVVNVGSTFGSIGYPCHSVYNASKFGLRGWTEALSREFAGSSVRFQYLAPRATGTAINSAAVNDLNRELGNQEDSPELVANELIALIETGAKRRFIGFPEKLFARINGLLPELVDKSLAKQLPTILRFMATTKESR